MRGSHRILLAVAVVLLLAGTADAWGKKKSGADDEVEVSDVLFVCVYR